ncbi:hypothetical protein ACTBVO_004167 [Yersinia enterocolitica]
MRDSPSKFLAFFGIHWITPVIGFGDVVAGVEPVTSAANRIVVI